MIFGLEAGITKSNPWETLIVLDTLDLLGQVQQSWNSSTVEKPLSVITLGQTKSENFKGIIRITAVFYLVIFGKWDLQKWSY